MTLWISLLGILFSAAVAWQGPTMHDFGDLFSDEVATHSFTFKNVSGQAITIDNVRPSCGCTVPAWTKAPILPDSTAQIRVEFRPRTLGYSRKLIKVYVSGQRKAEKLYIEAYVSRR